MRTVLVCVRTPLAAQNVASAAARLGLAPVVRTAVSDPEVMLRLAERPADVILADTALTRPDSVGFTRRVLARSPGAAVLLFGPEEPGVAAAAIAAGARGLIQGENDLVSAVAKAMLLLSAPGRPARGPRLPGSGGSTGAPLPAEVGRARPGADRFGGAAAGASRPGPVAPAAGAGAAGPPVRRPVDGSAGVVPGAPGAAATPGEPGGPAMVPVQRGEDGAPIQDTGTERGPGDTDQPSTGTTDPRANVAPEARYGAPRRGEPAGGNGHPRGATGPARRVSLTEREMQVLLGMADGKSNAEIGRELYVSEDTVKTHARRLFRKLGARDRAHAVAAGFRAGLVA
ncbi:LuxR C-terminal-related transcriptional regulator [Micromonospora zhanjiangensis]|uniref:LuxR C-terminal-related transcriptional regulator n=1 Tax=Micromonospora zhanjiangensis TaxID=1522057 RepID=A0ABV8KG14_9ACTN